MEGYLNLFKLISAIHINGIKDTKHTISIDGEKEFNKIHSLFLKKKKISANRRERHLLNLIKDIQEKHKGNMFNAFPLRLQRRQ